MFELEDNDANIILHSNDDMPQSFEKAGKFVIIRRLLNCCIFTLVSIPLAIAVITLAIFIILTLLAIIFIHPQTHTHFETTPVYTTKHFGAYSITYDVANMRSVNSTIHAWSINKPTRGGWRKDSLTNITADDYKEFLGEYCIDKGHLSPFADLGKESMTVVNMVPHYSCHNGGVWKQFELHVRNNYRGFNITTSAYYDDSAKFLMLKRGIKLFIPTRLCKTIRNVEYCIPHTLQVCGKPWCCSITPRLANVPCAINSKCVSI